MKLRLVLADDHSVVLQGLRALLSLEEDMEVVALCTDGLEAVDAVIEFVPDVLVIDATMPRMDGLEAHTRLREERADVPTVLLSATLTDDRIVRAVRSGIDGIVLKDAAASVLVDAIRAVSQGKRWIPPEMTTRVLELMEKTEEDEDSLTPREREVVMEVAAGKSNKKVAAALGISTSTVKLHLHKPAILGYEARCPRVGGLTHLLR